MRTVKYSIQCNAAALHGLVCCIDYIYIVIHNVALGTLLESFVYIIY